MPSLEGRGREEREDRDAPCREILPAPMK